MAGAKYVGYVGYVALAVGVGAAIAAAGQGTAHAETSDGKPTTNVDKGTEAKPKRVKPEAKLNDKPLKDLADAAKKLTQAPKPTNAPKLAPPKFDPAASVEKLKKQYAGDPGATAADEKTLPQLKPVKSFGAGNTLAAKATEAANELSKLAAVYPAAVVSTDDPGSNPFRADDPFPQASGMPDAIVQVEKSILDGTPAALDPLDPFIREGYEAAYRASQIVPYVNVPIPLTKILAALGSPNTAQVLINQLLLTTQPVSLLYYGYDEIADLLNIEDQAYALKQEFYRTIWDLIDSGGVLHEMGNSGI